MANGGDEGKRRSLSFSKPVPESRVHDEIHEPEVAESSSVSPAFTLLSRTDGLFSGQQNNMQKNLGGFDTRRMMEECLPAAENEFHPDFRNKILLKYLKWSLR